MVPRIAGKNVEKSNLINFKVLIQDDDVGKP